MGTAREYMLDAVSSKKLQQKQDSDTGFHERDSNLKGSHLPILKEDVSGELQKKVKPNLKSEASQSNQEEAASRLICEKITSNMQHWQNQHDGTRLLESNQEVNFCIMPEKELDTLQQKQNPKNGIHASQLSEASLATKREPDDFHQRESSDAGHEVSGSDIEERTVSSESVKDPEKPSSNPGVCARESDNNQVYHLMRHEKALEKLQPRGNLDNGIHRSQSDQGTIPSIVPGNFSKVPKDEPEYLQSRESSDSGYQPSEICDGERTFSVKREMASDILLPVKGFNGVPTAQSHEQKSTYSTRPEKAMEKLQPRRNPDSGGCSSQSDQESIPLSVSEKLPIVPKDEPKSNDLQPKQCLDDGNHPLVSKGEKCTAIKMEMASENLLQIPNLSVGAPVSESDQQNFTKKAEKLQPRRNPDPGVRGSQSDSESIPSKVLEKGLDDGCNWRKYGQKFVKGNEFIRSYYKCTYPNCQAKKQVERSHDGYIMDINYLGKHQHPKPQQSPQVASGFQARIREIPILTASNADAELVISRGDVHQHIEPTETSQLSTVPRSDGVTGVVSRSNDHSNDKDDCLDSKRQKREISVDDDTLLNKRNSELRHIVQTLSDVDIVNDGYRWRKYGQKLVKGNPNPRSYYRCSNAGCPVKKHVERASHDPKLVITSYEGEHDHEMPPCRTVSQNTTGNDASVMTTNGESRLKPGENKPVGLEMAVHISAN
ncbi:hypothetical protein Pfo_022190 [Paulownia fortunei]|nr:hypothetical protein Pfo_022190 [Paulownia fortunei]